jgi:DNA-binding NtrC family response regulator
MATLLVIEDETVLAKNIARFFEKEGHLVEVASDGAVGLQAALRIQPDVVIVDFQLPGMDGLEVIRALRKVDDPPRIVMVTGHASVTLAVDAMKAGSMDLLTKPVTLQSLKDVVQRALTERGERRALDYYQRREASQASLDALVGTSTAMQELRDLIRTVSSIEPTDQSPAAPILVLGETGTGKELVARAIHRLSPRRGKPFIAVNVGALTETLLESELFGHEKGAFTGAAERRLGRFELADTGTLFLDEIGEIPSATQVKLLRVLEEREVTRVGSGMPIPIDVRVVAATNRPLREHVEDGGFRADLFYRLNVLGIYLPPLRERRDDIPLLVRRFVTEFASLHDRAFHGISADALALLVEYGWPGNVRELRNLVESMVVLAHGREIGADDIPRTIRDGGGRRLLPVHVGPMVREGERAQGRELEFIVRSLVELKLQVEELRRRMDVESRAPAPGWVGDVRAPSAVSGAGSDEVMPMPGFGLMRGIEPRELAPPATVITLGPGMTMAEIERMAIQAALRDTGGNRRKAADLLGIGERTLYRKLREYEGEGIEDEGDAVAPLDKT